MSEFTSIPSSDRREAGWARESGWLRW